MMANVQEERVEVSALKGDYPFGFHDPDQSVFRARKGLDRVTSRRRVAMSLRPLADHVLIRRHEADDQQEGGIIIPDTAKERPQEGEILAVGPGRMMEDGHLQPIAVAIGNTVLFGKYAGTEIKLDQEDLLVMRESDLLGVLEG
jgi:chaperonin GroES